MMSHDHLNYGRHILSTWIEDFPVATALDIGIGHGDDLSIVLQRYPSARCEGVESNVHYANAMRAKGFGIAEINLERAELPYADASFDLVIANQIFEHVKDIFWILDQIARVLKPGGRLYLGVPNLASLHNRLLLALGRQPTCINSASAHVRGFTKPDVLNLLNSCWPGGFALNGFRGSNFYPFPRSVARAAADLFPSASVTIFFWFEKRKEYAGEFLKYPVDLETNFFLGQQVHHVVN
jgi:SAM-dependent methyltransferase